jgi:hypothetical protein
LTITAVTRDDATGDNAAVTLLNRGPEPVDLSGWMLLVSGYRATFPTTSYMTVSPGSSKIVHLTSSPEPATGDNIYIGYGAVDAGGLGATDAVVLLDTYGHVASVYPPQ